jgi:uncharacterized protein YwqG
VLVEWGLANVRDALTLVPSNQPTGSHLGGQPLLPQDIEWPEWKAKPLSFLAQVDLSQIAGTIDVPWMPSEGKLLFFYDAEQSTWGDGSDDAPAWRVIHVHAGQSTTPRPHPERLPDHARFAIEHVAFELVAIHPSYQRAVTAQPEGAEIPDDASTDYQNAIPALPFGHRLFGWPTPIQHDEMEVACQIAYWGRRVGVERVEHQWVAPGAAQWELLLQIDSDDRTGMLWGDTGTLYFWVRREDASKADFSNVWLQLQCY